MNNFTLLNKILNAFAAMVYIALGILILIGYLQFPIPALYLKIFAAVLLVYGLFRAFRFYLKYIKNEED